MKYVPTVMLRSVPQRIALALVFVANAAAQLLPPITDPNTNNPILGFETPEGWVVKSTSVSTKVLLTKTRTQGNFALGLVNPSGTTMLTSLAVSSTASAVAGIGSAGAIAEVDIGLPALDAASKDAASLTVHVSSPSRGLNHELVGRVAFNGLHSGIFNTLQFPIPEAVRRAINDAPFRDLAFELALSLPPSDPTAAAAVERQFLFDNLRVHYVPLVAATTSTKPPAGYGGSVDLLATGAEPTAHSFNIGAIQVPDSFHLEQGTAGTTTVKLALGHDGAAAFTCTYDLDTADKTGKSYVAHSCTSGVDVGDLVGANFAELTIVGGTSAMKLRAQLAANPVGDLVGRAVIPPMPTFWGNFDGCLPAPVPGKVHTESPSCAGQVAQANQIVTDYLKKANDPKFAPNWIVTPVPELARRHGNGLPNPNQPSKLALLDSRNPQTASAHLNPLNSPTSSDFPFDQEGHMNPGGDFDAFWRLTGDLNFHNDQVTGNSGTHFDAELGGDVVLFGQDVNVVSLNVNADTTSGSSPSATGSLHMFLFGIELPGGGNADASTGFNFNISDNTEFDLPPIQIWIFSVTPGATANVALVANGTLAATGISLSVAPSASLGVHVLGGINIPGQVSGGIDARIDLLDIEIPLTAQAGWAIDTLPQSCATTVNFALNGAINISSGGGEMDLVATIGPCPFCFSDSWPIFSWPPLLSTTLNLFSVGPTSLAAIPLPVFLCTQPLSVTITSPTSAALEGEPIPLNFTSSGTLPGATISCNNIKWGVAAPDAVNFAFGCAQTVTFDAAGPRTIQLNVTDSVVDQFGRTISQSASASQTVSVTSPPPGLSIIATNPANLDGTPPPFNSQTLSFLVGSFPATIQFTGQVVGSSKTTVLWSATDPAGTTTFIGSGLTASLTVPSAGLSGIYTITMVGTDSLGNRVGTATMFANVELIPR